MDKFKAIVASVYQWCASIPNDPHKQWLIFFLGGVAVGAYLRGLTP